MGVALSYNSFFGERHYPAKKKLIYTEMEINTQADFELCLFTEEEDDDGVCHCIYSDVFYHL